MPETLIRLEKLVKTYRSGDSVLSVLSELSFEIYRGESVAVVGESGVGKSTLLHLLGGLDTPTSGEVIFQSSAISSFGEAELADFRNRQTGYVWQNFHLLPEFTAIENVMMPLLIAGQAQERAEPEAREWLERVGLAERAHHRAGELSGGEQQRVTIARALVTGPKLLLADEPTGNLDQETGEKVIELLVSLPRDHGVTLVVATHHLGFAGRCDRVLRIEVGKINPITEPRP